MADGKCEWVKQYVKAHAIIYRGFNEGKGIWGTWELRPGAGVYTGGFHIWPEGMADPTQPRLAEEADVPVEDDRARDAGAGAGVRAVAAYSNNVRRGVGDRDRFGLLIRSPTARFEPHAFRRRPHRSSAVADRASA